MRTEALQFYGELLGLVAVPKPEPLRSRGGVWFDAGAQRLHVGVEDPFSPAKKAHPPFRVESGELVVVAARLEAAGVLVRWDDAIEGTRRFYAQDPWGNRVEILARP